MKFKLVEINSIETKYYRGRVHDLTVKNNHSYTVGGIVVHNSICSTRLQTGHGVPLLSSIMMCEEARMKNNIDAAIIADGGLRNSGDIVKALAAGADFALSGRLFAGCEETPGKTFLVNGHHMKEYRGMASRQARASWGKNQTDLEEGISTMIPAKPPVGVVIAELEAGIRSGLSYTGATTLQEFRKKAVFLQITGAGKIEGDTRG